MSWHRWVGLDGAVVGLSGFGDSAPAKQLFEQLGLTAENVAHQVRQVLGLAGPRPELEKGEHAAGPAKHGTDES
jgi:transketolase